MISELMSSSNNVTVNLLVVKKFGLYSAVYLSTMLAEQLDANKQNKLYRDKYFVMSRETLKAISMIEDSKQTEIEENLIDDGVLLMLPFPNNNRKHYYYFDETKILSILEAKDDYVEPPKAAVTKSLLPEGAMPQKSKKQIEIDNAMKVVLEKDPEIYELFNGWVEAIVTKYGYCAKSSLKLNEQDLNQFAKGDRTVKIGVLRIAVKNGWKDIQYSINDYKKENGAGGTRNSAQNKYQVQETEQQKEEALKTTLDKLKTGKNVF